MVQRRMRLAILTNPCEQVPGKIFVPTVADDGDDLLAGAKTFSNAESAYDIGGARLPCENTFAASELSRHVIRVLVCYCFHLVDKIMAEKHSWRPVANAVNPVHTLGSAGYVAVPRRLDRDTQQSGTVLLEDASRSGEATS